MMINNNSNIYNNNNNDYNNNNHSSYTSMSETLRIVYI
jgi:hypothetical protein